MHIQGITIVQRGTQSVQRACMHPNCSEHGHYAHPGQHVCAAAMCKHVCIQTAVPCSRVWMHYTAVRTGLCRGTHVCIQTAVNTALCTQARTHSRSSGTGSRSTAAPSAGAGTCSDELHCHCLCDCTAMHMRTVAQCSTTKHSATHMASTVDCIQTRPVLVSALAGIEMALWDIKVPLQNS